MIKGKHIAITGSLVFYKRKDAFLEISLRGGIPQDSVTKETDVLVVGYYRTGTISGGKSRKHMTAERHIKRGQKISIIREDMFLAMLWSSPATGQCIPPLNKIRSISNQTSGSDRPKSQ